MKMCDRQPPQLETTMMTDKQSRDVACDMKDAIIAGDAVLMAEQAALLRECRAALDDLFRKKPGSEALLCGSTTLGNLRAELGWHRPKGVIST